MRKIILTTLFVLLMPFMAVEVDAAPTIITITDNRTDYSGSQIPTYEKLEITFQVATVAENTLFPYDAAPPPGLQAGKGVSVDAIFTDPTGNQFSQPAFYYQAFEDQVKANKEWFYPTNNFSWKVRFSPNKTGIWKYEIVVKDSSGTIQSSEQTFSVADSEKKGFVNVSKDDARYFEYDNGAYFPALGFNLNGGDLDNVNPILGNIDEFQKMGSNGIELSRVWISQFSIYGEAYGKWGSPNRVHQTQEPRMGIVNPVSSQFDRYPTLTPPALPTGSENYMWLNFDETTESNGDQLYFTPCRRIYPVPVKQNTTYRVRVRYTDVGLEGPRVDGQPFGFAVKSHTSQLGFPTGLCNEPTSGTVLAATFQQNAVSNDPANSGWKILQGTFNSGTSDFLPYLFLTFNNVKSTDSDAQAGHVFIDQIWLEENSCSLGTNCANLVHKNWMSMHQYINQRDAYSFDKLLDLAKQNNIYLKAVMLEKNDRIFQTIDFNGQPTENQSINNFYGNFRTVTKVRWLQQAWWRYMQARWGYTPYIHSWELLNEGHVGNSEGHWDMADEFGKYMQCRVFGIPVSSVNPYEDCQYDHPNNHMVTTSFFGSGYPWRFWNNLNNTIDAYAEMDYVDQHLYATEGITDPAQFNDSAYFSYWLSTLPNNFEEGKRKPFIRGEVAWSFNGTNLLEINADGGEWLHDFIWAGINNGGLMEHFFGGGHFTRQLYDLNANPPYDHRPMFNTYYDFIKDIPLNNGNYVDAEALVSNTNIRAWGQKDLSNYRGHIWINNKNHTWKNVVDGVNISPQSANVTLGGFEANQSYKVEWWDTYVGQISDVVTQNSNSNGDIVLSVTNLATDTAVRIGDYTQTSVTPTPTLLPGDINGDGVVNILDFTLLSNAFGTNSQNADLNGDGIVNILDFTILSNNFGKTS